MNLIELPVMLAAIRNQHAQGQDALIFAPDALALLPHLERELPDCVIETKELTESGRVQLLVHRPGAQ